MYVASFSEPLPSLFKLSPWGHRCGVVCFTKTHIKKVEVLDPVKFAIIINGKLFM